VILPVRDLRLARMGKDCMTSLHSCDASVLASKQRNYLSISMAYATFIFCTGIGMRLFSDLSYSSVLTFGAGVQCFGFCTLLQRVWRYKSLAGISRKTVELYVAVLVMRLGSTLTRSGYLPVDRSGDWVYQAADLASLGLVLELLRQFRKPQLRQTYQEEFDTMDVIKMIPGCVVMAVFIHGNLNDSFFFDSLWTCAMNIDTIAMLPQLWMLARIGGEVEGMTAHFIIAIMISRACSFSFWLYGYKELAAHSRRRGPNIAGWQLLGAHALQLVLSADFLYHYVYARIKGRKLVLPTAL